MLVVYCIAVLLLCFIVICTRWNETTTSKYYLVGITNEHWGKQNWLQEFQSNYLNADCFSCQVKSTSSISSYKYIYYMHMIEFYILNSTLLIIIKFTIIGQAIQTASQIDYVEETFCGVIYMYVVVSLYTAKLYYYI